MIQRTLAKTLLNKFNSGKAIILIGPRQVGKTTLIKSVLEGKPHLFLDGDDPTIRTLLNTPNTEQLKNIIGTHNIVFIDEAQRIDNIGITLKIITDQFKTVQLIVSGSSAFDLNNEIKEPLTGRKWQYKLFPISWRELENTIGYIKSEQQIELRLRFGMYPDVITNLGNETEILKTLADSYLYKDLLTFNSIRKPQILEKLLKALAYQIGSQVSYNELSKLLGIDKNTVSNYIHILEQAYVIFRLPPFNRNLRNEIKKQQKIYFVDVGIRNAIIGNFNTLNNRNDVGHLWENFLISERIKGLNYSLSLANSYFWRTKQQQEIDYVEEEALAISAFEFKWNPNAKAKFSKSFIEAYNPQTNILHRDNFREFIL